MKWLVYGVLIGASLVEYPIHGPYGIVLFVDGTCCPLAGSQDAMDMWMCCSIGGEVDEDEEEADEGAASNEQQT